MGEIVNLRRVTKQRAKQAAEAQAAANRALHGATKAERAAERLRRDTAAKRLDGAALSRDGEPRE